MTLQDEIKAGIRDFLADPTQLPAEFKGWLPRYLEVNPPATQLGDIQNLYTMSSTVTGLGVKINGRIGMIRSGSSPYEYLRLTYDSIYGKWLSDSQLACEMNVQAATASTSFTSATNLGVAATVLVIVNAIDYYNSGLTPQISWNAVLDASADGITVSARPTIYEANTGTNVLFGTLLAHTAGASFTRSGDAYYSNHAWEDATFDATPTKSHWAFMWELKTSSGTGYLSAPASSFRVRWVG